MDEKKKIITHDGRFHADEIFALALLYYYGFKLPIERKRKITQAEFNNPDVFIVDVGMKHEREKCNFDHHQNEIKGDSPAAAELVFRWLYAEKRIDDITYVRLQPFIHRISMIDTGWTNAGGTKGFGLGSRRIVSVNSIIGAFNSLSDGFNRALVIALEILEAQIFSVPENENQRAETFLLWENWPKKDGVVVNKSDPFLGMWNEYAEKDTIYFLVCRSQTSRGWQIVSRSKRKFPIPNLNGRSDDIVISEKRSVAECPTLEIAYEYALLCAKYYMEKM